MAQLRGVAKATQINISRKGLTRTELFERTDRLREQLLQIITERGATPIRVLAPKLGLSYDTTRNHGLYLVSIEAATTYKVGLDTFFEATGAPYRVQRRRDGPKKKPEAIAAEAAIPHNPHMRVIKLLDRDPKTISKDEHKANRRGVSLTVRGSSMGMFDSY